MKKNKRLSRHQSEDVALIVSSGLFDEQFYVEQYPDVAATGMPPAQHYLLRGAGEGRDPSPHFSSSGYVGRYPDVKYSAWNPLVHYLRAGRQEGRLPDPLGDDARIIGESGLFDDAYYRQVSGADVPDDADPVEHYVRHGAAEGLDPSEAFSTGSYVRLNPSVVESGLNPLAHYIRHGMAGGLDSRRGAPAQGLFRARYATHWAALLPVPVVRVPGVGPRVTVLASDADTDSTGEELETQLVVSILLANSLGANLRLAARDRPPDAALLLRVEQRNSVALLGDVELAHVPVGGAHPLLMGDREVVVVSGWRDTQAAMASALRDDELVRLVQSDERSAYVDADERLLCAESLAGRHASPTVVRGQALLDLLVADFPHLRDAAVSFEPAFPDPRGSAAPGAPDSRTLLFLADPNDPRSLYWRGGAALSQAIERNVVDPDVWDIVCVGAEEDLVLPRGVRPRVRSRSEWLAERPAVDAVFAPHAAGPPPREAMSEVARGAAVLTTGTPDRLDHGAEHVPEHVPGHRSDVLGASENLLVCDPGLESMVDGLGRLTALGLDDELRQEHRQADHLERDWKTSTAAVVEFLHERLHARTGSGRHVH